MKESTIEAKCVKILRGHGCLVTKVNNINQRGWPDRLVVAPNNIIFFIEFKKLSGGVLSEYQKEMIKKLETNNAKVFIVANGDDFNNVMNYIYGRP